MKNLILFTKRSEDRKFLKNASNKVKLRYLFLLLFTFGIGNNMEAQIITTTVGTGGSGSTGDGGPALLATLTPQAVAFDTAGRLFIIDYQPSGAQRFRKVSNSGIISAASTSCTEPSGFLGLTVDDSGYIYTCNNYYVFSPRISRDTSSTSCIYAWKSASGSQLNGLVFGANSIYYSQGESTYGTPHRVFKQSRSGSLTTVAGTGIVGFSGDGGPATAAKLSIPASLTIDTSGNLYIADLGNMRIRKVDATGIITTIAGNGVAGFSGDGGPATAAQIRPVAIAVNSSGDVYIADGADGVGYRIRKISGGIITTVAGNGTIGFSGDGGPATSAQLGSSVHSIAVDPSGNLHIADQNNRRIRTVCFSPMTRSVVTSASADTVCAGTLVTFSSTVAGGGTSPFYQWKVNGVSAGTDSAFSYVPSNGDVVTCRFTGNNSCAFPDTAISSPITMVVNSSVTPLISISASATTVCYGDLVNFASSISNGGLGPVYQWKVNGLNVGTASSYSYTPVDGDNVNCSLTSNATCATPATVISSTVPILVHPVPTTYSIGGSGTYLDTGIITLSNSQAGVTYQLYNGSSAYGLPVPGTGSMLTFYVTTSGIYSILATKTSDGCTGTMASSANVIVNPSLVTNPGESKSIRVYPNPADDRLNIEGPQLSTIDVMDLAGRVLIRYTCNASKLTVDISSLKPGLYLVKINGQCLRKIIKE